MIGNATKLGFLNDKDIFTIESCEYYFFQLLAFISGNER
jgi:hypothetical protein